MSMLTVANFAMGFGVGILICVWSVIILGLIEILSSMGHDGLVAGGFFVFTCIAVGITFVKYKFLSDD